MSHWASVRSLGCFMYFDRPLAEQPVLAAALVDALVEGLDLAKVLKISTANNVLRWKNFRRKSVNEAISSKDTRSLTWMVGTPMDVRLGGALGLRMHPAFETEFQSPSLAWVGAETERWPEAAFMKVARTWLRLAAEHGTPLSGGVLAAENLKHAKIEMTQEFETDPGEDTRRNPTPFRARMEKEPGVTGCWTQIRRVYPVTLLGPRFAASVDPVKLAEAGAVDVERVHGSVMFGTGTAMLEAWDPRFLDATRALRRQLWSVMGQNPADDPDGRPRR